MCVNKWCYDCFLYIFSYLYSRNAQVPCPGHTPQLSGLSLQDGDLEVFIISEKEECLVVLHLPTGPLLGVELVPRCEPTTYQSIV